MKANIRRFFIRTLALLLTVLIMSDIPFTAFAMMDFDNLKIVEDEALLEHENVVLPGEGNYSYTPPDEGEFLIESVTGAVSITSQIPAIEFGGQTVLLPTFDYYKLIDQSGNMRFYQADVLKDPTYTSGFVYIGLYVEDGPVYSLHVHYAVEAENKLYNIMMPLTEEQFLFFTGNATELCLGTDEVSERLKTSGRVYKRGSFENYAAGNSNNGNSVAYSTSVAPAALNYVAENSYDSYTNDDGIIHDYVSDYFGEYYLEDNWTITDDPIVSIIPKELCFVLGEHIYVGKEYGFFIRVLEDTLVLGEYSVDIMVFDIIHITPSFTTSETGSSRIVPLFQYTYRAVNADNYYDHVDPTLTHVVFPHAHYDYAEYFLKDVGFRFTLDNPNALNPSDSGYVASEDDGAFMIQTRANARGVGLKRKNESFLADTVMFTLGFVPYLGTGLSVLSYIADVGNGFGSGSYLYTREEFVSDNEANINTYKTNSTDQIAAYGNLLKSQSVKFKSDTEEPRLFHVGGGYVEAKYVIARKTGSTYNKLRVVTSISVSVVEDNTWGNGFISGGELVNYGSATGTYETGTHKRLEDIALNGGTAAAVAASYEINIIKVVPKVSGTYRFFTTSSVGDPDFCITNATAGTSEITATDDIDGANNRNAALALNLVAGNVYYIEAFRYAIPYDYTLTMGYIPIAPEELPRGINTYVTTTNDSYQMFEFTAITSGYYELTTSKISGDPQVFLFDSAGNLLDSDDDSGNNLNAFLECYLIAGRTYYVAVQGYNGSAAVFYVAMALS